MHWKKVVLVAVMLCFSSVAAWADTIHLSVAASMTDLFKELTATFSSTHPEVRFLPNFASSGSLAKQIDQGAPADLFVSANAKWMAFLREKKLVAPGTDRIFAHNRLVFAGRKQSGVAAMADLSALTRIALGTPDSVPAGQYARQAMEKAGIYAELQQKRKLVMAKDVRQALLYADRGEVDGAFVYRTDALLARDAVILFTVPQDLHDRVSYPMALTMSGAGKAAARSFYDFLASEQGRAILERHGFETAGEER